jgi:cyclophilin family peptidyl-prolyl cis-trans isomerase
MQSNYVAKPTPILGLVLLLAVMVAWTAAGCGPDVPEPGAGQTPVTSPDPGAHADHDEHGDHAAHGDHDMSSFDQSDLETTSLVRVKMNIGDVVIKTYDAAMPITAGNFLSLVQDGYYDGVIFHRIEAGFVIQGGDPDGDGSGGPGWVIPLEINPDLQHERGSLSMARTPEPDSGGSQFFICLSRQGCAHLDGDYAVFGEVVEGMDVVDKIVGERLIGQAMKEVVIEKKSAVADEAMAFSAEHRLEDPHAGHSH